MKGNISCRNMLQGNAGYGGFDLQGPVRVNHHQQPLALSHLHPRQGPAMVNSAIHENFPQDCDQCTAALPDYGRGKSGSDEDEPCFMEDADDPNDTGKGKKVSSPWQRVKWTDNMVRLLITAVSYISEEVSAEHGSGAKRKCVNLQKKGKWKSVSKVMAEREHFVSPQQCEDKFNDLNKRYKRLNEILGRGTSCKVVENPTLLDMMDHISTKAKEEVRKILSSKHLHYEEMCSYHNGNRLHLPPDPDLQRSLRLALRSRDDHDDIDAKRHPHEANDEIDQGAELDDHGECEENQGMPGDHIRTAYGLAGNAAKWLEQSQSDEDFIFQTCLNSLDCNKTKNADPEAHQFPTEGKNVSSALQRQWMNPQNVQLQEKRLYIETQMLELEKERLRWQRVCRKKDRELETMRMENEKIKLENECLKLEIQQKEIEMGIPSQVNH